VRATGRYGGVVAFTGGLIGPPGTTWNYPGSLDGTPVFIGSSDVDHHVPLSRVDESAAVFARMGASVTKRIYPGMGHVVNDDEIAFARGLLDAIGAG
jgi:predicted esterase